MLGWEKGAARTVSVCRTTLSGGSLGSQNRGDEVGRHISPVTCIQKSCSVE